MREHLPPLFALAASGPRGGFGEFFPGWGGPGGGRPGGPRGGPWGGRGGPGGPRGGRGGRRGRKGDVRAAILALLAERRMHGYEMIQEISERSGGFWRLSPGSVYPTLQLLADEGLVHSTEEDGKRLFELTDEGRASAQQQEGAPPWEQMTHDVDPNELKLRKAAGDLAHATMQVSHAADSEQKSRAADTLDQARRTIYGILSEVETDQPADDE